MISYFLWGLKWAQFMKFHIFRMCTQNFYFLGGGELHWYEHIIRNIPQYQGENFSFVFNVWSMLIIYRY